MQIWTHSNHRLSLRTNGAERLTVLGDGNIGIGTVNPTTRLAVNGTIKAREIKVDIASWPDFVFDKDYRLPALTDIEKHINDKGHLPGIPSSSKLEANGFSLGEMDARLLRKIEELTLHLIKQEKEINSLKAATCSKIKRR
jgi:hypothetical protein